MMPSDWRPEHKLFPHQVGFTCPPFDWDAAPTDFQSIAPTNVGVHGWMLHVPDYVHGLDQRRANFSMLEDFAHVMSRNGADVAAQVGSNWVHASGLGVDGIRAIAKSSRTHMDFSSIWRATRWSKLCATWALKKSP